jgi:hypothetical protein
MGMGELLTVVLTNKTARGSSARKVAAAKATDDFAPWGPDTLA